MVHHKEHIATSTFSIFTFCLHQPYTLTASISNQNTWLHEWCIMQSRLPRLHVLHIQLFTFLKDGVARIRVDIHVMFVRYIILTLALIW